jgi:hypothetical protein
VNELLAELEKRGVRVGGQRPYNTLTATLAQMKTVTRVDKGLYAAKSVARAKPAGKAKPAKKTRPARKPAGAKKESRKETRKEAPRSEEGLPPETTSS